MSNKEKVKNKIYCYFEDSDNTLNEILKLSFLDYLALKESKESLANTHKES